MDVLLIGGAGGLGSAVALYLAERGMRVFSCDITEQNNSHKNIVPFFTDIKDQNSIDKTFTEASSLTDGLSAIISLAGVFMMDSFIEIPEENLKHIIEVNLMGVYRINKTFFPLLKKGGRIIVTTSEVAGLKSVPFNGMYCLTKTALEYYADTLRLEMQLLGYKVINIKPGPFKTDMVQSTTNEADNLVKNTKLFKMGTERFNSIIRSKTGVSKDPSDLSKVYYKAITSQHPRLTYYKNSGLGLKILSVMPRRLHAFVIKQILKK